MKGVERHTATLRAHDGDDSVGEATVGELGSADEVVKTGGIEYAVAVNQLRRTALILHNLEQARVLKTQLKNQRVKQVE